jgi:uncharacterized RmlC-like cupin family protein
LISDLTFSEKNKQPGRRIRKFSDLDSRLFGGWRTILFGSMHPEKECFMSIAVALNPQKGKNPSKHTGLVVRGGAAYKSEQGSDYQPGVSAETVGSKVVFLGIVTLQPGARTRAHVHERHETALYLLSGSCELWTGPELERRDSVQSGDYIYIPANVLHVAVNRGAEPALFMACRNEATAQESVVMFPEMDARVP